MEYFENDNKVEVTKNALLNLIMEKDTLFITIQNLSVCLENRNILQAFT